MSSSIFTSPASARQPVKSLSSWNQNPKDLIYMFYLVDRLITSKDHASVQLSVVDVDANGKALPTSTSFALSGQVRAMGESDDSLNRLATKAGRE